MAKLFFLNWRTVKRPVSNGALSFPDIYRAEDKRDPGYYLNNGDDWPDSVCSRSVTARQAFNVVQRFEEVYDWAMDDLAGKPRHS